MGAFPSDWGTRAVCKRTLLTFSAVSCKGRHLSSQNCIHSTDCCTSMSSPAGPTRRMKRLSRRAGPTQGSQRHRGDEELEDDVEQQEEEEEEEAEPEAKRRMRGRPSSSAPAVKQEPGTQRGRPRGSSQAVLTQDDPFAAQPGPSQAPGGQHAQHKGFRASETGHLATSLPIFYVGGSQRPGRGPGSASQQEPSAGPSRRAQPTPDVQELYNRVRCMHV